MDLILAADCVYFEPAFPLLVTTLVDLTRDQEPEILFCYKNRRKVSMPADGDGEGVHWYAKEEQGLGQ